MEKNDSSPMNGFSTGCGDTVTEHADIDKAVREMAHDVLAVRSSALSASGLRATMEVKRWFTDGRENCELSMGFWRETEFIDGLEDHIVREGMLVNSLNEFRKWVEVEVDTILKQNPEGSATA
jgi:hypothetical protein